MNGGLPDPAGSHAVLVGVSSYRCLEPIPAVANNLGALADLLVDRDVWGLPVRNCHLIENPRSVDAVMAPIHEAAKAASAALLVYFAGHGLLDQTSELYLGLPDSTPEGLVWAVRYAEIRREVTLTASRCPAKVVILDCCYSGAAFGPFQTADNRVADQAAVQGAYVMTATAPTSLALAPTDAEYTAFTGAILETINLGIPDGPPLLDMDTLFARVKRTLEARHQPVPQSLSLVGGNHIAIFRNRSVEPMDRPPPAVRPPAPGTNSVMTGKRSRRDTLGNSAGRAKVEEREGHAVAVERSGTSVTAALSAGRPRKPYHRRIVAGVLATLAALTMGTVAVSQRESWFRSSAGNNASENPQPASGLSSPASPPVPGTSDASPSVDAGVRPADPAYRNAIKLPGGDRAEVQSCAYFTGTFGAAPGNTLILVKRNNTTGDGPYVEYIFRWNDPARTPNWYGAQYFGEDNGAAGQWFDVELREVPLSAAQAAKDDASAANALARTGSRVASVSVKRVSGHSPDECPG
jgi:hypothetical protein